MKEYYHDLRTKTLSVAPSHPHVSERTDSRRNTTITVSAYIESYCFDEKNGTGMQNRSYPAKDFFNSRDSQEQAARYFKTNHYPRGEKISGKEYMELYRKYENELNNGTP